MTKKYELCKEHSINLADGTKLYQIRALKDFGNVSKGDFGGYIESEKNLSQEGSAWVSDSAQVSGYAWVFESAQVYGDAQVSGDDQVN